MFAQIESATDFFSHFLEKLKPNLKKEVESNYVTTFVLRHDVIYISSVFLGTRSSNAINKVECATLKRR